MVSDPQINALHPALPNEFIPPISRWTSMGGLALVTTFVTAVVSAAVIEYDVVVKAPALIRPVGELQLIEAQTEGTVSSVDVIPDQKVEASEVIATLSNTSLQTDLTKLESSIRNTELILVQLSEQALALDTQILAEQAVNSRTIAAARADLERNQRVFTERQVATQSDWTAAQAELEQAGAALENARAELEFARLDQQRYEQLADDGAVTQRELDQKALAVEAQLQTVEVQRQAIKAAESKLARVEAALDPSRADVDIAQERVEQELAKGDANLALLRQQREELRQRQVEVEAQLEQSRQELARLESESSKTQIVAPMDGTILQLNLRNTGQVVRPGEVIAQLSPADAVLEVKSRVITQDIGKVEVGQTVKLRVSAYSYTDYGVLTGTVTAISDDVIVPQSSGQPSPDAVPFYEVTIDLEQPYFEKAGRQLPLQAGMDARAEIITEEETVLTYIIRKARLFVDL